MDRSVAAEPNLEYAIKTEMKKPALSFQNLVILELKFTNRFPDWFRELVRVCNIMQCGASKYVESIGALGHRRLGATGAVMEEESRLSRAW
jgi:hypothetical protein